MELLDFDPVFYAEIPIEEIHCTSNAHGLRDTIQEDLSLEPYSFPSRPAEPTRAVPGVLLGPTVILEEATSSELSLTSQLLIHYAQVPPLRHIQYFGDDAGLALNILDRGMFLQLDDRTIANHLWEMARLRGVQHRLLCNKGYSTDACGTIVFGGNALDQMEIKALAKLILLRGISANDGLAFFHRSSSSSSQLSFDDWLSLVQTTANLLGRSCSMYSDPIGSFMRMTAAPFNT